jgi:cobalt/nickel transport system permease protein
MHIPDGFLSPPVWITLDVVATPAVGLMARRTRSELEDWRIPLMGVMGAFVFAAQIMNFPVGIGTSGHLVGGTLLAITLGPAAASLVMAAIVAIQAFVFQDGGIMALGANILNMAVAGVLAGYLPYRLWGGNGWRSAAIFAGGVLSVVTSACLALTELLLSGVPMPRRLLWLSLGLFLVSALMEGAITVAAIGAIERLNPAWVRSPKDAGSRVLGVVAIATVLLALVGVVAASTAPDGIWSLAGKLGLAAHSPGWLHSPLAGYELPGFASIWLRKAAAGLAGLALIYAACVAAGRLIVRHPVKERSI